MSKSTAQAKKMMDEMLISPTDQSVINDEIKRVSKLDSAQAKSEMSSLQDRIANREIDPAQHNSSVVMLAVYANRQAQLQPNVETPAESRIEQIFRERNHHNAAKGMDLFDLPGAEVEEAPEVAEDANAA